MERKLTEELLIAYIHDEVDENDRQFINEELKKRPENLQKFQEIQGILNIYRDNVLNAIPEPGPERWKQFENSLLKRFSEQAKYRQPIFLFNLEKFAIKGEFQIFDEHITPQAKPEKEAADSPIPFEKQFCQGFSLPNKNLNLEFRIDSIKYGAVLYVYGDTKKYMDKSFQITLFPAHILTETGVKWCQKPEDDGSIVFESSFDEDGFLENKTRDIGFIADEAAENLLAFVSNSEARLIDALKMRIVN